MYNNLKSHQFLSCIFVLVLATGCQFGLKKTRREVEKLEKEAAAAHKKIQGYINQEGSRAAEEEDESVSILGIPKPSNEIKALYKKITDAISAAKIKNATLATVSEQLKSLKFHTALLQAYASAIEADEARIQGSTVVDRATITKQIKPAVDLKDQGPQEPALQKVQAALTQLEALVKQIKTKAREDVGTALKEAADAQGSSAIQEVTPAVSLIKVELKKRIFNQDADAPTAVKAAKEAKALLGVLKAILEAEKAVQAATKETVEEAEKAVQAVEAVQELDDIVKSAIEKAVTALQTQLQEAKKKLPKGDAAKPEDKSKAESSPAIPGGDQGGGDEAASASGAQTPGQSTASLEGSELNVALSSFLTKPLDELTPAEIQSEVKRFKQSLLKRQIFNNTQEDILNTWNTAKASAQVDNKSLSEATEELAIAVNEVESWVQALKLRMTQKAAKDFATLSANTATKEGIMKIKRILQQDKNTTEDSTKILKCIDLWYGEANSQSASTAQTSKSNTP